MEEKEKTRLRMKRWRAANPERARATTRKASRRYSKKHPKRAAEKARLWRKNNPEKAMLIRARNRAKSVGVPFALTAEDITIPEFCPALGIPIRLGEKRGSDNSPSIDRFIPSKGYVLGNVAVISFMANAMKRNATLEELRKLVAWLETT